MDHHSIDERGDQRTVTRLIRSELRKLTTTRMPVAFLIVLVAIAALNASR